MDDTATLEELVQTVTCPVNWNGKRVRALHPFEPEDTALIEAISRGEFTLNGLRNRDLQRLLYDTQDAPTSEEARRRSAQVTRKLRMLRAHAIIAKVPRTHRYQVTELGRRIITAILTARHTPLNQLLPKAA